MVIMGLVETSSSHRHAWLFDWGLGLVGACPPRCSPQKNLTLYGNICVGG